MDIKSTFYYVLKAQLIIYIIELGIDRDFVA